MLVRFGKPIEEDRRPVIIDTPTTNVKPPASVSDILCSECEMIRSRRFGLVVHFDKPRYFARGNQIIEVSHRTVFVCEPCLHDLYCYGYGYDRETVALMIEMYGPRRLAA